MHQLAHLQTKLPGEGKQLGHLEGEADEDEEEVCRGEGRQEHVGGALADLPGSHLSNVEN